MRHLIKRVLFWTYRRGSVQYDIMCAVILAFIFLTPTSVFDGTLFTSRVSPVPAQSTESPREPATDAATVVARPAINSSEAPDPDSKTEDDDEPSDEVQ